MAKNNRNGILAPSIDVDDSYKSDLKSQCYEGTPLLPRRTSPGFFGLRHQIVALCFMGSAVAYTMRVNLSIALVAMVNSTVQSGPASPEVQGEICPRTNTNLTTPLQTTMGKFNWDSELEGVMLSAFFWGYSVTQIPGGVLAKKYGGKPLLGYSVLLTSFFTLLSPLAAWAGPGFFIATRVCQGLGQGMLFPAVHCFLSKWSSPVERSRFVSIVYSGGQVGTVIAMPLSGWLADTTFLGGWPAIFYVFGVVGIIWFCVWMAVVHESPADHPAISEMEKNYISGGETSVSLNQSAMPIPWKSIWTSLPVWAIMVAHIGQNWGFNTLLTELPIYMKNILHFDIKENSILSALPHLAMALLAPISGYMADWILRKGYLSTTNTRKLMNTFSHWLPAVALVSASYTGCDKVSTVALLTLAVGFNGFCRSGNQSTHLDIAPNYAGITMGITNGAANFTSILAPILVGYLTTGEQTLGQWRIVFFVAAGLYFVTNSFYLVFGTSKEQVWNIDHKHVATNVIDDDRSEDKKEGQYN